MLPSDTIVQRTLFTRTFHSEVERETVRRVVLPKVKMESKQSLTDSAQPNIISSGDKQAMGDYMKELEFKIRYMKNDIEFKKSKMNFRNTSALIPDSSNSSQLHSDTRNVVVTHGPQVLFQSSPLTQPHSGLSAQKVDKSQRFNNNSYNFIVSKSSDVGSETKMSGDKIFANRSSTTAKTSTDSVRLVLRSSTSNLQPLPYIPVAESNKSKDITKHHAAVNPTHRIVCCPSAVRTVISPLSESRTDQQPGLFSVSTGPTASAIQKASDASKPIYISPNKQTVVLTSKGLNCDSLISSSSNTCSTQAKTQFLQSKISSENERIVASLGCKDIGGNVRRIGISSLAHHPSLSHGITGLSSAPMRSRYKLVKGQESNLPSNSLNCTNSYSSYDPLNMYTSSTMPSHLAQSNTPVRNKSLFWKFTHKKIPKLKTQTAAKVISKYKFKRLSPTSASKTPPQLYDGLRESYKMYLRQAKENEGADTNNSRHIFNRRFINMSSPKHSNFVTVNQHKIDRRASQNETISNSKEQLLLVSKNRLKLDKRFRTDSFESLQQVSRSRLKLDKRFKTNSSEAGRNATKSDKSATPTLERRKNKHQWINNAESKPSPNAFQSKLSWRKISLGAEGTQFIAGPAHTPISKFKWPRPEIQAHNTEWQQSRNKLRFLLSKKQKNLRWKFPKYASTSAALRCSRSDTEDTNLVVIDGIMYNSSSRKLTRRASGNSAVNISEKVTPKRGLSGEKNTKQQKTKLISVRGVHFHIDRTGKKLSRTVSGNSSGLSASVSSTNVSSDGPAKSTASDEIIRLAASRAVNRSLAIAAAKQRKNKLMSKTKKQCCVFFGRFGKCHRGNNCPFIHDPEKVVVCTRFLRGKCDVANCPFSHKASVHKMPVCLFYLRGSCSRVNCPYLHVRVNPDAPVCRDFLNGFCGLGEKCKKIHSHICPSFATTGVCSRGRTCTLLHRMRKREQERPPSQAHSFKASNWQKKRPVPFPRHTGPLTTSVAPASSTIIDSQPSFISLLSSSEESLRDAKQETEYQQTRELSYKITPAFAPAVKIAADLPLGEMEKTCIPSVPTTEVISAGQSHHVFVESETDFAEESASAKSQIFGSLKGKSYESTTDRPSHVSFEKVLNDTNADSHGVSIKDANDANTHLLDVAKNMDKCEITDEVSIKDVNDANLLDVANCMPGPEVRDTSVTIKCEQRTECQPHNPAAFLQQVTESHAPDRVLHVDAVISKPLDKITTVTINNSNVCVTLSTGHTSQNIKGNEKSAPSNLDLDRSVSAGITDILPDTYTTEATKDSNKIEQQKRCAVPAKSDLSILPITSESCEAGLKVESSPVVTKTQSLVDSPNMTSVMTSDDSCAFAISEYNGTSQAKWEVTRVPGTEKSSELQIPSAICVDVSKNVLDSAYTNIAVPSADFIMLNSIIRTDTSDESLLQAEKDETFGETGAEERTLTIVPQFIFCAKHK